MGPMTLHPFFLLLALVGIVTGLHKLNSIFPLSMPIIFAVSTVGLLARLLMLRGERRKQVSADAAVDFQRLHAGEVLICAPGIKREMRGHDAAVDQVLTRIQRGLRLAGPGRSLGSFLLAGPTGTGKTFMAQLVAKTIYPEEEPVLLRMNQYKDHADVFTLLGPPPGHPGFEVGGALTRPVLESPYRVVIFDEIDKAHPDVRHCLYDILDTGLCREKSSGKTVHFGATVFFATCNAGVEALRPIWADSSDPLTRTGRAREALARCGFEKPFLARFDEILFLDTLPPVTIAEVACLQIARHWRQFGIEVDYASPEILVEAVRRNVEFSDYGVRQVARLIQEMTTPSIEAARRDGYRKVRLELDAATQRISAAGC
ncbi:MAG: ATP-dependent Clp protease ATP-binding subunit [Elusimicrobia bacterium]|nr:ATP-dependent Clp protease ATP-binding subunit [Elusimicrobiota bacterium]